MIRIVQLESPCKLNLHLEVGALRSDGFHPLESIFHLASLSDRIRLEIPEGEKPGIVLQMKGGPEIAPEENLAWKAAELYAELVESKFPLKIIVEKEIPDGAGLGGGSSNAAAVLAGLNFLFHSKVPSGKLFEASARLGSDVPFFLKGGAAHVTGRGEFVEPLPSLPGLPVLIVVPDVHVSTGKAFGLLDESGRCSRTLDQTYLKEYLEGNPSDWSFFNSFQDVVSDAYPVVGEVLSAMQKCSPDFLCLSGSGSAVFALFLSVEAAKKAEKAMKKKYSRVYLKKLIEKFQTWV